MTKVVEINLEWKYTPSNYLEQPISISKLGVQLEISNGIAIARIEPATFENNSLISNDLTKMIENRLYAVQVLTHKNYSLSKPSRSDLREDGKRNIFLEVDPIEIKISLGTPDLIISDKNGKIISDTKQERLNKEKWFSEKLDRYRASDIMLEHILKSYQMSVKDSDNEFVYLYEIRDALSSKFGNQENAIKNLGINKKEWDAIGILANTKPLKQGRHRGKSAGVLRAADSVELEESRKAASNLIEKYLIYLEKTC